MEDRGLGWMMPIKPEDLGSESKIALDTRDSVYFSVNSPAVSSKASALQH